MAELGVEHATGDHARKHGHVGDVGGGQGNARLLGVHEANVALVVRDVVLQRKGVQHLRGDMRRGMGGGVGDEGGDPGSQSQVEEPIPESVLSPHDH